MPRVFTSFFFFFFFFSIQSFCLSKDTVGNERKYRGTELLVNTLVNSFLLLPQLITNNSRDFKNKGNVIKQFCRLEVWHRYDWARSRLSALLVPSGFQGGVCFQLPDAPSSKQQGHTPPAPTSVVHLPSACGQESLSSALKDSCDSMTQMDITGSSLHLKIFSLSTFKFLSPCTVTYTSVLGISAGNLLTRETFCLPQPTKKVTVSYPGFFFKF